MSYISKFFFFLLIFELKKLSIYFNLKKLFNRGRVYLSKKNIKSIMIYWTLNLFDTSPMNRILFPSSDSIHLKKEKKSLKGEKNPNVEHHKFEQESEANFTWNLIFPSGNFNFPNLGHLELSWSTKIYTFKWRKTQILNFS